MSTRYLLFCILFIFSGSSLSAQQRKEYTIQYVTDEPKVDGILDENVWQETQMATDFTQTIPSPDQPSNYTTQVKMLYTKSSIYVGAKMYQPKSELSRLLTARDVSININADVFAVFFDTYDDHQNGFAFRVTAAGVQQDERLSNSNEYGDVSWDAVWLSKVKIVEDYWCVEMEIPFSALRFTSKDSMQWGINFFRLQRQKNESSYWNKIDPQQRGFLAQTGILKGFKDLSPPVRLFLFPYLSSGYYENPVTNPPTHQWLKSGGLDMKYGLSESFTLDVTLIPDFSQVISDNLVRNLSPFEQQLTENRPFFTEGVDLFNKADVFYSRRIGARPVHYFDAAYQFSDTSRYIIEKNPNVTGLYNALKISGRTKNNTGIGIFNSVARPMYASIFDKKIGSTFKYRTQALTNYNIVVWDKPLKGQSYLNFTNTNVLRNGFDREANVSSLIWNQFDKKQNYLLNLNAKASFIHDSTYGLGTYFSASYGKVSGKYRFNVFAYFMSPSFDKRDMGLQFDYNQSHLNFSFSINENKPKQKFLQLYNINTNHQVMCNAQPFLFKHYQGNASLFLLFKNFWDVTIGLESKPFSPVDFYQLGSFGKKLIMLPYFYTYISGSSDSRKKLFWNFESGYGISIISHSDYSNITQGLRYQFSQQLEIGISGNMTRDNSNIGFAFYDAILGQPIAGKRDVREYEGQLNIKLNLTPNLNITGRFRHYNTFIKYLSFHTVSESGAWQKNGYTFQPGYDENFNLQNIDVFFNWMFRPGSRVVLSYKQWLSDAYLLNSETDNVYFENVYRVIRSPHSFELNARVIFFIDYNNLKKKGKG